MIKLVSLLSRPAGVSRREFQEWWHNNHAPLAAKIPGLQRYVLSFPEDPAAPFDGMAELYFRSADELQQGLDSSEGIASRGDTLAHIGGRTAMIMIEHEIPIAGS